MPSQSEVPRRVRAAFECEPRINLHRYPVLKDGVLTLDGEVEHIVTKRLSLELAAAAPGIDGLVDRLRVTPTLLMRDGAIRDSIRDILLQAPAVAPSPLGTGIGGEWKPSDQRSGNPPGRSVWWCSHMAAGAAAIAPEIRL
jgi:hypothetical protein